jgi:hypothetical protein
MSTQRRSRCHWQPERDVQVVLSSLFQRFPWPSRWVFQHALARKAQSALQQRRVAVQQCRALAILLRGQVLAVDAVDAVGLRDVDTDVAPVITVVAAALHPPSRPD